jgi:imidazolonepropionase-like amidohydrolase
MTIIVLLFSWIAFTGACGMTAEQKRQAPLKTAIINANVWSGAGFAHNRTVVLVGGIISNANPAGATIVDAKGGYLIPGLIDTHCHIQSCSYLNTMRQYGVTTALDMGTYQSARAERPE